jgi:hypothetical protein
MESIRAFGFHSEAAEEVAESLGIEILKGGHGETPLPSEVPGENFSRQGVCQVAMAATCGKEFFPGRIEPFQNDGLMPVPGCEYRRGESGGPAADNDYIVFV